MKDRYTIDRIIPKPKLSPHVYEVAAKMLFKVNSRAQDQACVVL